jgi:hypothetical protein
MQKILIGLTGRHIENETVISVFELAKRHPGVDLEIAGGYGIASNRNILANRAVDGGFEYLLFVDSDIVVPVTAIDELMACMERTKTVMASGWYKSGTWDDKISAAYYIPEQNYYEQYKLKEWEEKTEEYVKIGGNGLGLALINTELFKSLWYPYFKFVEYEHKGCLSEDLYLFDFLRRYGWDSYAVRGLRAGHIKMTKV